jgi:hypothetical protein
MPSTKFSDHPHYNITGAKEIDENPLIAHLRLPPENDKDAFLSLGLRPDYDPNERMLSASIRRLRINRLRHFFAPTSSIHRRALIGINSQIFDGYLARNPMTAQGQRILHGQKADLTIRPTISLIAGHSGMGKSTLLDRILTSIGNQDYQHSSFRGVDFPERQILWLRRNVPEHCTVRTLCSTFGDYTDRILGLSLYQGIFQNLRGGDRNLYLSEIRKIITNHHVGVLVLDEFQNLSLMGVGAEKIIAFLVNLRDELGLPIVIAGTYKALRLLERDLSTARRLVEGGYYDLQRPTSAADESFQELCEIAWDYQWTREPSDFSSNICDALYEVSQGITGIMLSVFSSAQFAAIETGSEKVDADLILKVFNERMKPLHPAIKILKSGNPLLLDKFDDLYTNSYSGHQTIIDRYSLKTEAAPRKQNKLEDKEHTDNTASSTATKRGKAVLTEEQVKNLVMAEPVTNITEILEQK